MVGDSNAVSLNAIGTPRAAAPGIEEFAALLAKERG
jgi:hypothetical protein